ncbi:hypothetical protein Dsin_011042 [Dipteronia sinensis]|uniref:Uncharacterized protein n=1 Tax=Dipteronia sinensis TaxID=43782 RepID=A0AAE0EDN1_9ROSI|nr:hypothetical protein Dsin_011042 [Dipteronia sinensis]
MWLSRSAVSGTLELCYQGLHVMLQFNKEAWHNVEDCKLRFLYVAPPRPPSPVREGSEEGFSPRASFLDNRNISASEISAASRGSVE